MISTDGTSHPHTVAAASLRSMLASSIGDCAVITGAIDISDIVDEITASTGRDVTVVHNSGWSSGMRSSVLAAIALARERRCSQLVIGLADQPFVPAEAWRLVADAPAPIAVATYDGRRGNPVKLADSVWIEFENTPGDPDAGARSLVETHLDHVAFVPCPGSDRDIDTQEDLRPWKH
jgi:CTP:molybdopterin cytidylyltransferase MocA